MTRLTHRFHRPDRFVVGTVGVPGDRTFFLQVRQGNNLVTVRCHKDQVSVLVDHLDRILDELARLSDGGVVIPPRLDEADDDRPLELPMTEEFTVGTMALSWDSAADRVQIELFALGDDQAMVTDPQFLLAHGADDSPDAVDVRLSPTQARQFAARARTVLRAGRPVCPFCAQPINPGGHICPRANGYRRPLFL
ncbi:DUF3090 family protein [Acidipropionibacterium timonense]|uniref:DUF3090 family protein n=1 Tax=Acidipropionibacterium timonense TaxID=2161818 RepID=UPI0010326ADC|nr:DUF3090 family protein [Acidipropionibacterium timonense]